MSEDDGGESLGHVYDEVDSGTDPTAEVTAILAKGWTWLRRHTVVAMSTLAVVPQPLSSASPAGVDTNLRRASSTSPMRMSRGHRCATKWPAT